MKSIKLILFISLILTINTSKADQNLAVSSDNIIRNLDGSFTVYKPVLLRGNKVLRFYAESQGVCRLFGYDFSLKSTNVDDENRRTQLAAVDNDGNFVKIIPQGQPYVEVTCYNKGELTQLGNANEIISNPDGSVTIIKPILMRGTSKLPLFASAKGICQIFGHNEYLGSSVVNADKSVAKSAKVDDNGDFLKIITSGRPYKEVTCYNEKYFTTSVGFKEKIENADGSITLIKPVINRGRHTYAFYTTTQGVCKVFGYGEPLSGAVVDSDKRVSQSVILHDNGKFQKVKYNGKPYAEVTCLKKETGFFSFF